MDRVSGTVRWRHLPETPGSPESGLATGTLSEGVSGKAMVESTASHPQGQYLQKLEKNKIALSVYFCSITSYTFPTILITDALLFL